MPNWVTNKIIFESIEDRDNVLALLKGATTIDFNRVIKMPADLQIEDGSVGNDGRDLIIELVKNRLIGGDCHKEISRFKEKSQEDQERALLLGCKYLLNQQYYGAETWYHWCIKNWGTKWNACEPRVDGLEVYFDTAWNAPIPVIQAIVELRPTINFLYYYADEDWGYNAGSGEALDGELSVYAHDGGSNEAYEALFEIFPDAQDYYYKENGVYKYKPDPDDDDDDDDDE